MDIDISRAEGDGAREGHPVRDARERDRGGPDRGVREDRRRGGGRPGRREPAQRARGRDGPRARRGGRDRRGVRRHPRGLRPGRRRHGAPGDLPAPPRRRGRAEVRPLLGQQGGHPHRCRAAGPRLAHRAGRPRQDRGDPSAERAGAHASTTPTASGCKLYVVEVRHKLPSGLQVVVRADTRAWSAGCSRSRCPRSSAARWRSRRRARGGAPQPSRRCRPQDGVDPEARASARAAFGSRCGQHELSGERSTSCNGPGAGRVRGQCASPSQASPR